MNAAASTVRVIVVNYNGGSMTVDCLRAIVATDWPRGSMNLVLVDNGSTDGVAETVASELPEVEVIRSDENLGFAGGVNLGLRDLAATTTYVALVNNDAIVPPGWLRPLARALDSDSMTGAACPKVLLADDYEDVQITGTPIRPAWWDRRRVTAQVTGARVDGEDVLRRVRFADGFFGPEFTSNADDPPFQWASEDARLLLPALPGRQSRELCLSAPRRVSIVVRTEGGEQVVDVGTTPTWFGLPPAGRSFEVINNVGSELRPDGYVQDRGYLERDVGQYDHPEPVFAWYGGATLLAASYVRSVGVFDERLFAYYEDVELAWRGRRAGWRYVTAPESVVRHLHMATSSASAPRALYFNERNRLLVVSRYWSRAATLRAVLRFVAITASYVRRDVIARALSGRRVSWTIPAMRLRALRDCLRVWLGMAPHPPGGPT